MLGRFDAPRSTPARRYSGLRPSIFLPRSGGASGTCGIGIGFPAPSGVIRPLGSGVNNSRVARSRFPKEGSPLEDGQVSSWSSRTTVSRYLSLPPASQAQVVITVDRAVTFHVPINPWDASPGVFAAASDASKIANVPAICGKPPSLLMEGYTPGWGEEAFSASHATAFPSPSGTEAS